MNEKIEQWLPWYVNGTLSATERAEMERYLAGDADARLEVAAFTRAANAMKSGSQRVPTDRGLYELMSRIHAEKSTRNRPAATGFLSALSAWFGTSWTQPAFALAVAVIGVQSFMMLRGTEDMQMRGAATSASANSSPSSTARAGGADVAYLRVLFKPTATEGA